MRYFKLAFICAILLFWYVSVKKVYFAALGPDVSFKLDSNHILYGWPGFIVQVDCDLPVLEGQDCGSVHKFAITEKYIIAKANSGWFAINRKTFEAWGCCESIRILENIVGEDFGELDVVESFPQSYIFVSSQVRVIQIVISLVCFVAVVGIATLGKGPIFRKNSSEPICS